MNSPVENIEELLGQCWDAMISSPNDALLHAKQALSLSDENSELYCKALSFIGLCYIYQGQFEEASVVLNEGLAIAVRDDQVDNSRRINNALGMCYQSLGRYAAALEHFEFTADIARKQSDSRALVPPLINMAMLLFDIGDIESSESILTDVLGLDFTYVIKDNVSEVYLLQAQILLNHLNFADAKIVLDQAELIAIELDFTMVILRCKTIRGRLLRLQGNIDQALFTLQQIINDVDIVKDGADGVQAYIEMAKALFSLQQNDKAIEMLQGALARLDPPANSPQRLKVLDQLAYGYQLLGDFKNELVYLKQSQAIERSAQIQQTKNILSLRSIKNKHDQDRLNKQLIDKENQMLKQSYERLSLLNDIAHQVAMTLNFSELGKRLFLILEKHLDVHFISLLTLHETEEAMSFRFIIEQGEVIQADDIPLDQRGSNSVKALLSRQPVLIDDSEIDIENFVGTNDVAPRTMLFIPLILEDEVLGVFSMQSPIVNRFKDYEIHLMVAICKFISIAVSNIISHEKVQQLNRILYDEKQAIEDAQERIAYMAYHDSLTSLPNRQALEEFVERRINDQKRPFHLVYIDLDGFKSVNDKYGHRVGDGVLIELSNRIKDALRQRDFPSRIGGDEFVLIVDVFNNDGDLAGFLSRLLTVIERPIVDRDLNLLLSASIGSAQFPSKGCTLDELMHNADSAMYEIKRKGKGGVFTS